MMRERDQQNLGHWDARPAAQLEPIEVRAVEDGFQPVPHASRPPQGSVRRPVFPEPQPRLRGGFWIGLVIGLVPLALLGAGLVGYLLRTDGTTTTESSDEDATIESVTSPTTVAQIPPVSTTEPLAVETSVLGPGMATALVAGGVLEVDGVLPADLGGVWLAELSTLADGIGVRLDDQTELADDVTAGELTVQFPGAVVFLDGEPESFEGDPHELFHETAHALEHGSASLTIAAFTDPSRPEDAHLALFRAEHVHEHLVELGADPTRLAVEIRPLVDAATGPGVAQPAERRVDLEFSYAG